ncbi:sigma-54-dependent Fis family transcriptional regulator [Desulfosporosinus sp. OT]|uniref:sigma-54-dependent Fis family transcriptional regulator n=1 Tax=Desulfosporosinus sp. OT TaxID=913865 RepID=UPI000223A549|nr:sigma-54-dependent Fis family transcriptional regulator [Desulfosporosinus sp. OT]EGW41952.1 sensory box protein [Desulfosporosinus sp. OT]
MDFSREEINLLDVIDLEFLQQFQDTFARVTGVAALTLDKNNNPVTRPINFNDICMKYNRSCSEGLKRCEISDKKGAEESTRTGKPAVYHCENGMVDFAAPIMLNGVRIGAILGGQVLSKQPEKEKFIKHAEVFGIDPDEYLEALNKVKIIPEEKIKEAANLLYLVSSKISKMIANQLRKEELQEEKNQAYELLSAATSSVREGLMAVDNDGKIIHINPAAFAIMKLSDKDVVGKSLSLILGPNNKFSEIAKNCIWKTDEEIVLDQGGERIHCTSSSQPILKENGTIVGVVFTLREIRKVRSLVNRMVGATARFTCEDIIGESEGMKKAFKLLSVAANSRSNVLLTGESGTGKELFAQAIHNRSGRSEGPFVAVNCAALPRELIQSELFGYNEGAFTGAKRGGNPGKFELANEGTIFLDEIGDMPMELQVNLLRVIQERKVTRVGGEKVIPVNVRIIAATNKDLMRAVEEGRFREDLYYRLNVLKIHIPPLRERGKDIDLLTIHLINIFSENLGKEIDGAELEFFEAVRNYSWPGNVRELQNAVEYAMNMAEGEYLSVTDLPCSIHRQPDFLKEVGEVISLTEIEKITVESTFNKFNGNITQTARALGIGRNTLYDKLRKLGVRA